MKQNLPYLKHILDEINFLIRETDKITYEDFLIDELLKRGCARSFEIIGEAVKNLSVEFKDKHEGIDWKKISGMRDKSIHYYFGVNYDIVWKTIKNKLPVLKEKIKIIIKGIEE